ncbi:hypothetical protein GUITHDRAFT_121415 [Guillardia theta CCMP2712]|uniref:Uncharacterized protein n=1 Tax=Guillardia theta (strain CCMP2712) TaxID=905079 RepID=L1I827_GUITC|nr:hypothetical protein GUITHDRAFT_121415 [Guillardia theta CCMP2712]EKX32411.1 hypothetical protein GUITHDRAFT_121415 [Guillardia theta CCMP2712]|eukprot:XP_005819391.1 hypothetical protein GUITHDRAFT_121415 [Guillardia theta CCMP2712]
MSVSTEKRCCARCGTEKTIQDELDRMKEYVNVGERRGTFERKELKSAKKRRKGGGEGGAEEGKRRRIDALVTEGSAVVPKRQAGSRDSGMPLVLRSLPPVGLLTRDELASFFKIPRGPVGSAGPRDPKRLGNVGGGQEVMSQVSSVSSNARQGIRRGGEGLNSGAVVEVAPAPAVSGGVDRDVGAGRVSPSSEVGLSGVDRVEEVWRRSNDGNGGGNGGRTEGAMDSRDEDMSRWLDNMSIKSGTKSSERDRRELKRVTSLQVGVEEDFERKFFAFWDAFMEMLMGVVRSGGEMPQHSDWEQYAEAYRESLGDLSDRLDGLEREIQGYAGLQVLYRLDGLRIEERTRAFVNSQVYQDTGRALRAFFGECLGMLTGFWGPDVLRFVKKVLVQLSLQYVLMKHMRGWRRGADLVRYRSSMYLRARYNLMGLELLFESKVFRVLFPEVSVGQRVIEQAEFQRQHARVQQSLEVVKKMYGKVFTG